MIRFLSMSILLAALAAVPAWAFWGWSDSNQYSEGRSDGRADARGDADAEAEAEIRFDFTGRMRASGDVKGDTDTDTYWRGYGYDQPYYYGVPGNYGPYGMPYAPAPAAGPAQQ